MEASPGGLYPGLRVGRLARLGSGSPQSSPRRVAGGIRGLRGLGSHGIRYGRIIGDGGLARELCAFVHGESKVPWSRGSTGLSGGITKPRAQFPMKAFFERFCSWVWNPIFARKLL